MSDAGFGIPIAEAPARPGRRRGLGYVLRILRVTAGTDYKVKYSGSVLGYFWTVGKPLALFTTLYYVFGHIFKLNRVSPYYPQSLLIGIVCFYFFADGTMLAMYSVVVKEGLLRKLIFPRIVIPISAAITAAITFMINLIVVAVFVAYAGITPQLSWLLLIPLLLELFAFVLGVGFILATLFVKLRDIGQIWELAVQILVYASPVMYPIAYLPPWAQRLVFLNPFTQIMQDARALVLYPDKPSNRITVSHALGHYGRLAPIGITAMILLVGVTLFRRQQAWMAEGA